MSNLTISTEVLSENVPVLFRRFEQIVGENSWRSREEAIRKEMRSSSLLRDFLIQENSIVLTLTLFSSYLRKHGRLPSPLASSKAAYQTCMLISIFIDLYDKSDEKERNSLIGRLRGAFANPNDLKAVQFEWLIAVNAVKRGFFIDLSDTSKKGTFDILATRDQIETEVECKVVTGKKGRQIQKHEALRILDLFKKDFSAFVKNLKRGLVVRVILPGRLPTSHAEQKALCESIRSAIIANGVTRQADFDMEMMDFEIDGTPYAEANVDEKSARAFLEEHFSIRNKATFSLHAPKQRAFLLTLESRKDDDIVDAVVGTIKDACDRQLTGTRPGIVCVQFSELDSRELRELADETRNPPTYLRVATSKFLDSRRLSHLIAVAFFSDGDFHQIDENYSTQEGSSYFFKNEESPFYNDVSAAILR